MNDIVQDLDWKVLCNSKVNLNNITWWFNKKTKEYWIFLSSQETDKIFILNGLTGEYIKALGGTGDKVGQLNSPIDLVVFDDYLYILEQDNNRVQIFSLPDVIFIGFIGEIQLKSPRSLSLIKVKKDNKYYNCLFVSENLDKKSLRPKCVYKYIFNIDNKGIDNIKVKKIGNINGEGKIMRCSSIEYDAYYNRLLILDSYEKNIKIYDINGNFIKVIDDNIFNSEPIGIKLMNENNGRGIYFIFDRSKIDNLFHIYDRETLSYISTLKSDKSLENDNICIINHNGNKILYVIDDESCVLAVRLTEKIELSETSEPSNFKEYTILGVLGSAIATFLFLKK